jgi:hypothetical protein
MWSKACSRAGISRIITPEDRAAGVSMCAKGVSRVAFERVLSQVFEDWQQFAENRRIGLHGSRHAYRAKPPLAPPPLPVPMWGPSSIFRPFF